MVKSKSTVASLLVVLILLLFYGLRDFSIANEASGEVNILLVAISGVDEGFKEWQPTIDCLKKNIPDLTFNLIPVIPKDFDKIKSLVASGAIDFVITQPAMYVDLELSHGISRILTLEKMDGIAEFGSLLITKSDSDIHSLADIENKRVAGVAPLGFGGWLIGYYEMLQSGVDPYKQAAEVVFPGTQNKVLDAVLSGEVDLGVIRTGILEKAIAGHRMGPDDIRVINEKKYTHFNQRVSTPLFPEWAFARTTKVSNDLANRVSRVLISIPANGEVARKGRYWRWTMPYDYQPVHNLLKELRVGPYREYGKITFAEFVRQHIITVSIVSVLSVVILLLSIVIFRSNRLLISENEQKVRAFKAMEHMATYDELTQLPNRRLFFELSLKIFQKARRDKSNIAILYMDLDGFKRINDTFGHNAGDRVLVNTAKILKKCLRENDVVARVGGDEFVCVISEVESREAVEKIINRIIEAVPKAAEKLSQKEGFGISIGGLFCSPDQEDIDNLIKLSDDLMYKAKAAGKNRYVIEGLS
ncbi:hypothetical protein DSCO28_55000 [Desulfosarcina ovata subsp. sediminis]|uniref:GGDEF domain-containing protein n=1 Tax=Desulfosarcina ovata subsp. sediminis TaxID=885957 RepID=A0A5K7ZXN8_9BACT|nr:diguanylate cyclase [Desulfosarcina ovata]BBO84934.1 hypothetical protein DSCO28_55000 [Desulfosarcina ovata subsp. sediminis]